MDRSREGEVYQLPGLGLLGHKDEHDLYPDICSLGLDETDRRKVVRVIVYVVTSYNFHLI